VNFAVTADAYDRFMGKYFILLGPQLADYAGVRSGQRAIDVGCGPGALTGELVEGEHANKSTRRPTIADGRRRESIIKRL